MADAKTITDNQVLGQRGIALITEIVLKMGYVFPSHRRLRRRH
jgi:hypothetical protein